jgi:hypothetical protein
MLEEDAAGTRPRLNPSSSGVLAEGGGRSGLLPTSPTVKDQECSQRSSFFFYNYPWPGLEILNKSLGL